MKAFLATILILSVLTAHCGCAEVKGKDKKKSTTKKEDEAPRAKRIVHFRLFTRENAENAERVDSTQLKEFKLLKPSRPTKVIIHGWMGDFNCRFSKPMRRELLSKLDINLIVVDWSEHGSKSVVYSAARKLVPEVGRLVAEFLDFLAARRKIQLSELHVLGFSLGGHISGIAGKLVKNGKIGRITGLDPAGPEFSLHDHQGRLSTDSAQFVDVIHTSSGFLGIEHPIGHIDFYPNSGKAVQPGCTADLVGICSHERSYYFYLESITNPKAFSAIPCSDWKTFKENKCKSNNIVHMGEHTPRTARGVYYFQTNRKSPFGKELAGISFS